MSKVIALVSLPVIATLGYLTKRNIYKAGQIDQKYTDKAKLEAHNKDII